MKYGWRNINKFLLTKKYSNVFCNSVLISKHEEFIPFQIKCPKIRCHCNRVWLGWINYSGAFCEEKEKGLGFREALCTWRFHTYI